MDSSAISKASRSGAGKVRHVKTLWVQGAVKQRKMNLRKIAGAHNPADVLTKPLGTADMRKKVCAVGADIFERRPCWADVIEEDC